MKKVWIITLMMAFVFTATLFSYADDMELKSVDTILTEIQEEQGVKTTDEINADDVSQAKLEELGDSVMEAMIGDSEQHDQMDIRLGGDGSASLTAFHTRLGYNYLVGYPNGMMTLMTSGTAGSGDDQYNWGGMMGNRNARGYGGMMGYFGGAGMIIGLILLIVFVVLLFLLLKVFLRKQRVASLESPFDILKRRFAAGEITEEEYEKMAEALRK